MISDTFAHPKAVKPKKFVFDLHNIAQDSWNIDSTFLLLFWSGMEVKRETHPMTIKVIYH